MRELQITIADKQGRETLSFLDKPNVQMRGSGEKISFKP